MIRHFLRLVCFTLSWSSLAAQNFEFTENKGQWNPEIRFKGELSIGAFFLKSNGYRVVQHHPDDFAAAMEFFKGHPFEKESTANTRKLTASSVGNLVGGGGGGNVNAEEGPLVRSHAYDLSFVGASGKPQIIPERELAGYSNYFIGDDPTKWASYVKTYGAVRYANIYPGIDVRYFAESGFLKYDIIVQPGADPSNIVLRYDGAQISREKNGDLVVKTSVSEVRERAPYTYQLQNGIRKQINCQYVVAGNTVRFRLEGYNRSEVLVIDPTLVFSTFSGSTSDNWGYTATYDAQGNAYGGGIVFGNGWPTTVGAFQRTFGGGGNTGEQAGFDIGLMKLNPGATQRIYSTYLGGGGNEQPHSLVVDGNGNLIVSGRTTSTNFPVVNNNRVGNLGGWDIIVTKFNAAGSALIGSIEIGGGGDDGVNIKHKTQTPAGPSSLFQNYGDDARSEVLLDRSGNIYVASCTRSNNFPVTPGVFQTALRGSQDALLLKFNPNMGLLFATLLGGNSDDAAYVLYIEDDNNILIAGGTTSNDFPGDKTGTVGPVFTPGLGISDGFVARFNSAGTSMLKSVYIGTDGTDQVYGIQKDRNGFVYVMGTSSGNFGVRNAAYSMPNGKQFIAKMQPDFSAYVYSTTFGPNTPTPNISPTAFLVDRCENVYVSGWGGQMGGSSPYPNSGTNGLPVTADALDPTTDGKDFYFFVLEHNATSQLYGTFFGQQDLPTTGTPDHVDGGTSRFDPTGVIYQGICAHCSNTAQFPTTPGVVAPTKPTSANCNLAVIKIAFNLSGIIAGIKSTIDGVDGDTSACAPTRVDFRDTIGIAQTYRWLFGDGTPEVSTTQPQTFHNYNAEGTYRVRLIAEDLTRCFPRDTSYMNIRVRVDRITLNATATKLDPCESNAYRFDNLSSVIPAKPFSDTSFTWFFGDNSAPVKAGANPVSHQYPGPGTYNVRLVLTDTNFCNAPDTFLIQLRVSPNVVANFDVQSPGCAPYDAIFTNTTAGGQTFEWDFGDGGTSTDINPVHRYGQSGAYTVRLIAIDPNTCNLRDTAFKTVNVLDGPTARYTYSPNPPEENIITTFTNLSDPAVRYEWDFGDGTTLVTLRRDTIVRKQFPASGTYNVCLVAINDVGCRDTVCQQIEAIVNPLVDVVTAFTPNADGVNDKAVVIGFGVAKMAFRIYNRWGQLVFESNDPSIGWDGRFQGKAQPMDVYAFTLDAELITGEKVKKSGSITLVR